MAWIVCPWCNGSGECHVCHGTGRDDDTCGEGECHECVIVGVCSGCSGHGEIDECDDECCAPAPTDMLRLEGSRTLRVESI